MAISSTHSNMSPGILPILLLALTLAICGCADPSVRAVAPVQGTGVTIHVISHGWHTGIAIPADRAMQLDFLAKHFEEKAEWYEIGWGDRRYYQADDPGLGLTLRAGLWPTESILHVTALPQAPGEYFPNSEVIALKTGTEQYGQMIDAMAGIFKRDTNGNVITDGKGLYGDSLFFESTGSFHAFNNCNGWTAVMLKRGGLDMNTFMTLTADGVMQQARRIAEQQ